MSAVDSGLAFLFPGQGSQTLGMLKALSENHPEVHETFAAASEVLGFDLWEIVQNGPAEELNRTQTTQPVMLAAGVAAWKVWCRQTNARPAWFAGHSLGEYTALVCAGALKFEDAVRLVALRGRLMQEAVPADAGAMAAILGLEDDKVTLACTEASTPTEEVMAANFNAPGQVVVAGIRNAVLRAVELAKSAGAKKAVLLPVSVPSHCSLMEPVIQRFSPALAETHLIAPAGQVVHNVDVSAHADPDSIRTALCRQLSGAVRWAESVQSLSARGVQRFVECGPGRVLAGLNRRIVPSARTEALFDPSSLALALELAT